MDPNERKMKSSLLVSNKSCCENCKSGNTSEFRKLLHLNSSGLTVFVHNSGKKNLSEDMKKKESVILHNVGNRQLSKSDYFTGLSRYKTNCFLCKCLIQRVCNLICDISEIREDEVIAVCEHCKRSDTTSKCKKCDYIVKKFLNNQIETYKGSQQALKVRLYEVRRILSYIVNKKNVCDHIKCQPYYDSNAELKILLELIKTPIPTRNLDVDYFPSVEFNKYPVCKSSREGLQKIQIVTSEGERGDSDNKFDDSLSSLGSFCICKYLHDRSVKQDENLDLFGANQDLEPKVGSLTETGAKGRSSVNVLNKVSTEEDFSPTKESKGTVKKQPVKKASKKSSENKENIIGSDKKDIKTKKSKGERKRSSKQGAEYQMLLNMIKTKDEDKKKAEKSSKQEKIKNIPVIADLPEIKRGEKKVDVDTERSESVIECGEQRSLEPTKMIHGTHIIPLHPIFQKSAHLPEPLLFRVRYDCLKDDQVSLAETVSQEPKPLKSKSSDLATTHPGILRYELSNRKFIDKGWTKLPTTKVMRRMNIYKMVPSNPQFDWFSNHKHLKSLYYNTGEKLAEIDESGGGRWFYKNGLIALDYSNDQKKGRKYIVYSCNDVANEKNNYTKRILALFDHLGNGIVYDHIGNPRLKYNQSEGLVIDTKIGPPGRWKWHTLNDPPVLQQVFIDTQQKTDACLTAVVKPSPDDPDMQVKPTSEDMIAIELDNFVREKARKMLQSFKPFEIRIKAVKINDCFSLRIVNQANVYLQYRCGHVSLKLNTGLVLISSEIIDTTTSDVSEVATPYDHSVLSSTSNISI